MRSPKKISSTTLCLLFLLGAVIVAYINRMNIFDWWRLRSYVAPSQVSELALQTTMNSYGTKLFYVNRPSIDEKAAFNASCRDNEQTIVLGCYISTKRIHILDVTDTRLDGVEQVTAAHEMLHEAYQRLSSSEKKRIDNLLLDTFRGITDKRIIANIESYKSAKADIANELHSILGTEVVILPSSLEQYYQKYFNDRSKIVAFSDKYESELTSRKDKVAEDDKKLAVLIDQIKSNNKILDSQSNDLKTRKNELDQFKNSANIANYNAGVPAYNRQVSTYNSLINNTNQLIVQYRALLDSRNALVTELQTLSKALDSQINTRSEL